MLRLLFYVLIVIILALGFGWLADHPGDLVATIGSERYRISILVAAAAMVAIVAASLLLWWLIKSIIFSPVIVRRHFRARKRDRGYQSLSTGLIAAGAGDIQTAKRMSQQAGQLLSTDQEPLIRLLEAQTHMLEGRDEDAHRHFTSMSEDPETRLLGLRGLFIDAQRRGKHDEASHHAAQAAKQAPHLEWASSAVLGRLCAEGAWDQALSFIETRKQALRQDKETFRKERAALLCAKAMAALDTDPTAARNDALTASKLDPDLVPAAVTAAQALFTLGEVRKGSKLLEKAWKNEPHPDIASTYVHGRTGDTAFDRLKRAQHLASLRPNHVESNLALARAAYDANDYELARNKSEEVIRSAPRESAYLLLADIEEAQTGDQGRVKQFLAQAIRAPHDPAWTSDGHVYEQWMPASPLTGRLNSFEWKVAAEKLPSMLNIVENEEDADLLQIQPNVTQEKKQQDHMPQDTDAALKEPELKIIKKAAAEPEPTIEPAPRIVDIPHPVVDDPGIIDHDQSDNAQTGHLLHPGQPRLY